jgi:type IV pilus biogenesis protein CpaD/CtpE
MMPGLDNTATDWKGVKKYGFGCTIESVMAKQIERPADLAGTAALPETSDGRRLSNSIDSYRDGVPNEKLEGINSTDEN